MPPATTCTLGDRNVTSTCAESPTYRGNRGEAGDGATETQGVDREDTTVTTFLSVVGVLGALAIGVFLMFRNDRRQEKRRRELQGTGL